MSDDARTNRIAEEFSAAERALLAAGINSTIVVFGSSRAIPPDAAKQSGGKRTGALPLLSIWYEEARQFGRIVSERGGALSPRNGLRDNVIVTGGGPGIMEAANRGAAEAGAPSIGFNIDIPSEQMPNEYITRELSLDFRYFAIRKMHFAMRANALAIFPGGFGTIDELFDLLTLRQTHKTPSIPIVLFCREYWDSVIGFDALVEAGTIAESDLSLFGFADSAETGWQEMLKRGLKVVD